MANKQKQGFIRVRDFGGGLNTALSEALIPNNMSPFMYNFDVLETNALKSRSGMYTYATMPTNVKEFSKLYLENGYSYWFSVLGTYVYVRQDGATEYNTSQEAEDLLMASYWGWSSFIADWRFDNGDMHMCIGTSTSSHVSTFQVPSCDWIALDFKVDVTGSYKLDSGSWTTIGVTATYPVLNLYPSAGTHTIKLKPPVRTSSSLYMGSLPVNGVRSYYHESSAKLSIVGDNSWFHTGIWMYDDVTNTANKYTERSIYHLHPDSLGAMGYLGAWTHLSLTHYSVYSGIGNTVSSVARTTGWHRLDLFHRQFGEWDPVYGEARLKREVAYYVDKTLVTTIKHDICSLNSIPTHADDIFFGVYIRYRGSSGTSGGVYFDEMTEDYQIHHDMAASTDWTLKQSVGTATVTWGSTSRYHNEFTINGLPIDVIHYGIMPAAWSKKDSNFPSTTDNFCVAVEKNKLYYGSVNDNIRSFNGTACASVTVYSGSATLAPTALRMVAHKSRLFVVPGTEVSLLRYSAPGNPENWREGGYWKFSGTVGGFKTCTGLVSWNDLLFYFGDNAVWALDTTGSDSAWVAREVSRTHGCISPRSLAAGPNSIIFRSADGIRAYGIIPGISSTDGTGFLHLSKHIDPTIRAIDHENCIGVVYKNRYWLFNTGASTEDEMGYPGEILIADLDKLTPDGQPVWIRYGMPLIFNRVYVDSGANYGLYAHSDTRIYKLDTGGGTDRYTLDGTPVNAQIDARWRTPPFPGGGYETRKHYRTLYVAAKSEYDNFLSVTPVTDEMEGTSLSVGITASTAIRPVRIPMWIRGRSLSLNLATVAASQLEINEVDVVVQSESRR